MGYQGAKLAPMFDPEVARATARKLVEKGREELLAETVRNTAVDDSPFPSRMRGTARASWKPLPIAGPVVLPGEEVYETGIRSEDPVTSYLEYGTGEYGPYHRPYLILPKNPGGYLRFYSRKSSSWVFAKSVMHPGIHPQRPLATGVALTEHRLPEHCAPIMAEWIARAELRARAQ